MSLPLEKCTGCGTCKIVCPHKCIDMKCNSEGFYYPDIDSTKCVNCSLCEKRCPLLQTKALCSESSFFAVKNKDLDIRKASSSGGVFTALAQYVLLNKGYVCAAKYTKDFMVEHVIVDDKEYLAELRGAKYVQSKSWQCFEQIKDYLEEKKLVLYVGTPCQVAGLNAYLNKKYDNLILIDMICHGVPSEKVWEKYLKQRTSLDTVAGKLLNINQRSKSTGWSNYQYSVKFYYSDNKEYSAIQYQDLYLRGFVENLYLRPSCAQCEYKNIQRISDFTLGDFWGIWNQHPEFDDNFGVSAVSIHTKNAQKYWEMIKSSFDYIEVNSDEIIAENPSVIRSSIPHNSRTIFFNRLDEQENICEWIQECLNPALCEKNSLLKKFVKKFGFFQIVYRLRTKKYRREYR